MSVWKYTRRSNNPELCSFRNWGCYKSYLNTVFYLSLHMKCLKQSPPTGPGISVRSSIIMWTQIFRQAAENIKKRTNNGCTECSYCMPCPFGVNIPKNFRIWNDFSMYGKTGIFPGYGSVFQRQSVPKMRQMRIGMPPVYFYPKRFGSCLQRIKHLKINIGSVSSLDFYNKIPHN